MYEYSVHNLGEEHSKMLDGIKEKSVSDPNFRSQLLSDPVTAIAEHTGMDLPKGIKLRFIENNGAALTVVLPDMFSEELSDSDLEGVAGGDAWIEVKVCAVDGVCGYDTAPDRSTQG